MASVEDVYMRRFTPDAPPARSQIWGWFFMRLSGLVLVFLVLGHMAIMHVLGGGVERVNFSFVAARWTGAFWRSYDWLLLALALLHGGIGARTVIRDHIRRTTWRKTAVAALYSITAVLLVLGTAVIVTFDASQMPGT
jgi:succinate dehydrogenase / fumarate reductase, membrane anchor subunit